MGFLSWVFNVQGEETEIVAGANDLGYRVDINQAVGGDTTFYIDGEYSRHPYPDTEAGRKQALTDIKEAKEARRNHNR